MVMIRPKGKPAQIAEKVLKTKGIKINKQTKGSKLTALTGPYLQH